jgi:hypothetical protein
MVPAARVWSDAQLRAAEMYIHLYALPEAARVPCAVDGARMGEHRGVKFLRGDDGTLEVQEDETPDAAMTALLESYNASEAEDFPF